MASILAGLCLREKQRSTLPGKLKRNPLLLPCCVWLGVVLDQVAEVGNGSSVGALSWADQGACVCPVQNSCI